jgi:hypothetical protein
MVERSTVERGAGCALMLPAALIGFAGLTDGVGPTGWLGISELFGCSAVCLAASLGLTWLIALARRPRLSSYLAIPTALGLAVGLINLINWLGLAAPMTAKIAFTSSLQIIGSLAAAACLVCISRLLSSWWA